ncbi:hypothetical protein C8J56DRAFT_443273 [Mycena floridula]|nr:hypothetical protein C8J56DRAFT_443273 [Mycena floridula]
MREESPSRSLPRRHSGPPTGAFRISNAPAHKDPDREIKKLRRAFLSLSEQLRLEKQRGDEAEDMIIKVAARLKEVHKERLAAVYDSAKANAELKLYKIQLQIAQDEIVRAQQVVAIVEEQRHEAESSAANARSTIRQLNDEKALHLAREEGRQMGIVQGLDQARYDYQRAREAFEASHVQPRIIPRRPRTVQTVEEEEEEEEEAYTDDRSSGSESSGSARHSVAPSQRPSVPPSVQSGRRSNAPSARQPVTQADQQSIASAAPTERVYRPILESHPIIDHNILPAPHHPHFDVPPDNFVPVTAADNFIRLPPPHELSIPPPAPRTPSPALPVLVEERNATPETASTRRRHHASPTSNSTTLSQFDLVSGQNQHHHGRQTPLSVIPEVPSPNYSSYSAGHSSDHYRNPASVAGSSTHGHEYHHNGPSSDHYRDLASAGASSTHDHHNGPSIDHYRNPPSAGGSSTHGHYNGPSNPYKKPPPAAGSSAYGHQHPHNGPSSDRYGNPPSVAPPMDISIPIMVLQAIVMEILLRLQVAPPMDISIPIMVLQTIIIEILLRPQPIIMKAADTTGILR